MVLFVAYYFSVTLFYHSHVINGKEIIHSHFYLSANNIAGEPVNHAHTQNELFTLQIISQFVTIVVVVGLFLNVIRILLNEYLIPLSESIHKIGSLPGCSLRAPPSGFSLR